MKKKLLYLLLLFSGIASAQIVNIPDINFKNKLLSAASTNIVAKDIDGNSIVIDINSDSEIQNSEALLVYELNINNSNISDLTGIEAFENLQLLNCNYNELTILNVTDLSNLNSLECRFNNITTLNVSGLINLTYLNCGANNLNELDVSTLVNLVTFNGSGNEFNTIDLSSNISLETLICTDGNLTTLNLNSNVNLTSFSCYANELVTLYIKNGQDEIVDEATWIENPTLEYICADDFQVDNLIAQVGLEIVVDSFCSETPDDSHNTIMGTATFDGSGDGCSTEDLSYPFVKIRIDDGVNHGYAFTNVSGEYTFYTQSGDFTVTPVFEEDWFTVTSAEVNFPVVDGSVSVQNFCIEPNGDHANVEVTMVPIVPARPGFDAVYKISYKNTGNQVSSGTVTCNWDYQLLNPLSVDPVPDTIDLGTYSWDYSDLQPFENREILMTLLVNGPTDIPAVNIDDVLPFTATIEDGEDINPDDNEYILNQIVVGSYDPNNIVCIEGGEVPVEEVGEYLHYVVNFENTGTFNAEIITITHVLNEDYFDINSIQVLNSSHDVKAKVNGNVVRFVFESINLGVADHGNILFKLKSKANLQAGDHVINQASIVFDYNTPIITNQAVTEFAEVLGIGEFIQDNSVKVYPNPVTDVINIAGNVNIQSISLYDIQGRLLQTMIVNDTTTTLDVSSRAKGVYFLKITSDKGIKVEKIVKQ